MFLALWKVTRAYWSYLDRRCSLASFSLSKYMYMASITVYPVILISSHIFSSIKFPSDSWVGAKR